MVSYNIKKHSILDYTFYLVKLSKRQVKVTISPIEFRK